MSRLVAWTRAELDSGDVSPLLITALFLHQFLLLRPFADGNGRLACALAVYLLVRAGYDHLASVSIEAAVERRRDECALALRRSADGDATPWVAFFLSVVADTMRTAQDLSTHRQAPLSPRQERLLAALRDRGAAKIGELLGAVAIPRATAKRDLKGLVTGGYVVTTGVGKGTIYYPSRHQLNAGRVY